MGIVLSNDAHALGVVARIKGKERTVEVLSEDVDGEAVHTSKRVEETVANRLQFKAAEVLVNRARAALKKFATSVEPIGFVTDAKNAAAFRAELDTLRTEIADHNGEHGQCHPVKLAVLCLPIGRVLDEGTQLALCEKVSTALAELGQCYARGDIPGVAYWLQRNKNVAGLMPAIVGNVVHEAIKTARDNLKYLREQVQEHGRDPVTVGAELSLGELAAAVTWVSRASDPNDTLGDAADTAA